MMLNFFLVTEKRSATFEPFIRLRNVLVIFYDMSSSFPLTRAFIFPCRLERTVPMAAGMVAFGAIPTVTASPLVTVNTREGRCKTSISRIRNTVSHTRKVSARRRRQNRVPCAVASGSESRGESDHAENGVASIQGLGLEDIGVNMDELSRCDVPGTSENDRRQVLFDYFLTADLTAHLCLCRDIGIVDCTETMSLNREFAIPGFVRVTDGRGGLPKVTLLHPSGSFATSTSTAQTFCHGCSQTVGKFSTLLMGSDSRRTQQSNGAPRFASLNLGKEENMLALHQTSPSCLWMVLRGA